MDPALIFGHLVILGAAIVVITAIGLYASQKEWK